MPQPYHRSRKLIQPRVQLMLTLTFLGTTLFCLVFQFLLFASAISGLGMELRNDSEEFFRSFPRVMLEVGAGSLGLILPLAFLAGVLATHRVAGPLHRFTLFLDRVKSGDEPPDCKIRRGDYLHDFCRLLNETTVPLRKKGGTESSLVTEPSAKNPPSREGSGALA